MIKRYPFLAFLLAALAFNADKLLGPYGVYYLFDVLQSVGVHYSGTGHNLLNFGPTAWDPFTLSGHPAFTTVVHPWGLRSWALAVVPMWFYFGAMQVLLGALFMYGVFRMLSEYFDIRSDVATLLALCLGVQTLGSMMIVTIVPLFAVLFMWCRDFAVAELSFPSRVLRIVLMVVLASTTCPVFVIPYFIPLAFVLVWLGRDSRNSRRILLAQTLFWGGYVLVQLPYIWSLFDFLPNLFRHEEHVFPGVLSAAVLFLKGTVSMLSTPTGAFSLGCIYCLKSRGTPRKAFFLLLVLALMVGFVTSPFYDLLQGTLLHKMHLMRLGMVSVFATSIVAGFGIQAIIEQRRSFAWIMFVALVVTWTRNTEEVAIVRTLVLFLLGGAIVVWRGPAGRWCPSRKVVLAAFPLVFLFLVLMVKQSALLQHDGHDYYAKGFGSHKVLDDIRQEYEKDGPFRVACIDVHPSVAKSHLLETVGAKDELIYYGYSRYMAEVQAPQFSSREASIQSVKIDQMFLFPTRINNTEKPLLHTYNQGDTRAARDLAMPLLLSMDVRYLVSAKPIEGIEAWASLVARDDGLQLQTPFAAINEAFALPLWIYRVNEPLPRARFVPKATVVQGLDNVMASLSSMSAASIRTGAVFDSADVPFTTFGHEADTAPSGTVRMQGYTPDAISLKARTEGKGFVIVANNHDPDWQATLNGRPVQLLRANGYMQAVPVPDAGEYDIELTYEPTTLWHLQWVSLLGILLCVASALAVRSSNPDKPGMPGVGLGLPLFFPGPIATTSVLAVWGAMYYFLKMARGMGDGRPFFYVLWVAPACALLACMVVTALRGKDS